MRLYLCDWDRVYVINWVCMWLRCCVHWVMNYELYNRTTIRPFKGDELILRSFKSDELMLRPFKGDELMLKPLKGDELKLFWELIDKFECSSCFYVLTYDFDIIVWNYSRGFTPYVVINLLYGFLYWDYEILIQIMNMW